MDECDERVEEGALDDPRGAPPFLVASPWTEGETPVELSPAAPPRRPDPFPNSLNSFPTSTPSSLFPSLFVFSQYTYNWVPRTVLRGSARTMEGRTRGSLTSWRVVNTRARQPRIWEMTKGDGSARCSGVREKDEIGERWGKTSKQEGEMEDRQGQRERISGGNDDRETRMRNTNSKPIESKGI